MRLPDNIAQGVADGEVTLAFRRWEQAPVTSGDVIETDVGPVRIDEVEPAHSIADAEAHAAGYDSPPELARTLTGTGGLYRLRISPVPAEEREPERAL